MQLLVPEVWLIGEIEQCKSAFGTGSGSCLAENTEFIIGVFPIGD